MNYEIDNVLISGTNIKENAHKKEGLSSFFNISTNELSKNNIDNELSFESIAKDNSYYNINNFETTEKICSTLFFDKNSDNTQDILTKKKKYLIEISKNLTKIEYLEIFNIIQNDNCNFTRNTNGVFINLQNVTENTLDKIFDFLNFIKHKKEDLNKQEEFLVNVRKNIIESVIEKPQDTKFSQNMFNDNKKIEYELSDSDTDDKNSNYLVFSSDEDNDIENKISLKKKKIKYTGKKLKIIKSIKDGNENNKNK
jgi:hypothetical protein